MENGKSHASRTHKHTLRVLEVDDFAIILEHVHLLNGRDGVHTQALQGVLELLVIGVRGLAGTLVLSTDSPLATSPTLRNSKGPLA